MHRSAQVPECYEEHLLRFVHHATGKLEDVAAQAVAEFQDRIIVGEEVSARLGEADRPCSVLSITSVDHGAPRLFIATREQTDSAWRACKALSFSPYVKGACHN